MTAVKLCAETDLLPDVGVCALVAGEQVAIFLKDDQVYGLANYDPFSDANVISRGIVGDLKGKKVVSSPVYKQHFCLETGVCLEDETVSLKTYHVERKDGHIYLTP